MINKEALDSLLSILEENKVRCGVGGSFLLQMYELYDEPQDVDFWVYPDDLPIVRRIFCNYPQINEKLQLPEKYHYKICFEGIYVDFVACFIVKPNKNEFLYNIQPDSIEWVDLDSDRKIPCTSLEDWYIVYRLLNRKSKADIIRTYLRSKNRIDSDTATKLSRALDNESNVLPKKIKEDIGELAWEEMQITIADYDKTNVLKDDRIYAQ